MDKTYRKLRKLFRNPALFAADSKALKRGAQNSLGQHLRLPSLIHRLEKLGGRTPREPEEILKRRRRPLYIRSRAFTLLRQYRSNTEFRRAVKYTELYTREPIAARTIVYENFHGDSVGDNPAAIFREILGRPEFSDYKHVWVRKPSVTLPTWVTERQDVEVVEVHSVRYLKHLATAKYLINSTTFPPYFSRRPEQVYINTWHGTPLKTLGRDQQGTLAQHKNIQRNFAHTTHLVSPNRFTSERILESHDLDGLFPGTVLEVGYPRIDTTLRADRAALRDRIMPGDDRALILYAPTWRGEVGKVTSTVERLTEDVRRLSAEVAATHRLVVRVHPLAKRHLAQAGLDDMVVAEDIETNELLAAIDLLITDYSSVFFDFLVTGRPIVYYTYDMELYLEKRGMYLDMQSLPGAICETIEAVAEKVMSVERWWPDEAERLEQGRRLYCAADDGDAAKRVVDIAFNNIQDDRAYRIKDDRKRILLYCGGFLNNGITVSAINLLSSIDHSRYQVVLVDKGTYDSVSKANVSKLPRSVRCFYRVGQLNSSIRENLNQHIAFNEPDRNIELLPGALYEREFRRLFGDIHFDVAIDFSGYVPFWTLVFAHGNVSRRVIFQHNQMAAEHQKIINGRPKHRDSLDVIFRLYRYYDVIACVSRATMERNAEDLERYAPPERYAIVTNTLDLDGLLTRAYQGNVVTVEDQEYQLLPVKPKAFGCPSASLIPLPREHEFTFIALGRLSPEKDHEKLLRAYRQVLEETDRPSRLVIAGDGVLKHQLIALRAALGLELQVTLLGQVGNPFPVLRRCQCLVLSSNHEGQPMVLLEALALGVPTVATDIPGNRSVLEGTQGLIVQNSEEGLRDGMLAALRGEVTASSFDAHEYNRGALQTFYNVIEGTQAQDHAPRPSAPTYPAVEVAVIGEQHPQSG